MFFTSKLNNFPLTIFHFRYFYSFHFFNNCTYFVLLLSIEWFLIFVSQTLYVCCISLISHALLQYCYSCVTLTLDNMYCTIHPAEHTHTYRTDPLCVFACLCEWCHSDESEHVQTKQLTFCSSYPQSWTSNTSLSLSLSFSLFLRLSLKIVSACKQNNVKKKKFS